MRKYERMRKKKQWKRLTEQDAVTLLQRAAAFGEKWTTEIRNMQNSAEVQAEARKIVDENEKKVERYWKRRHLLHVAVGKRKRDIRKKRRRFFYKISQDLLGMGRARFYRSS